MRRGITGVMISDGLPPGMSGEVTLMITGDRETLHAIAEDVTSRMLGQISTVPSPVEQPWAQVHRSHGLLVPGAFDCERCERCGQVVISANGTTPMGAAQCSIGPTVEDGKALSSAELDAMGSGDQVRAGAFSDHLRNERVLWVKLHNGRWETARQERVDDNAGVSSIWLANNRHPMLDT